MLAVSVRIERWNNDGLVPPWSVVSMSYIICTFRSGTTFNFALVTPTGLTDEERARLAEVVATTLNNGDLTVSDEQLTITDTSVVSGGDVGKVLFYAYNKSFRMVFLYM